MKIAVFHELPPGGAKNSVNIISKLLKKKKVKIDLYTSNKPQDIDKLCFDERFYFEFSPKPLGSWKRRIYKDFIELLKLYFLHKKIAKVIDSKKYDLVFINASQYIETPFIARFLKTKKIFYCHDPHDRLIYDPINKIPKNLPFHKIKYEIIKREFRKKLDRSNFLKADVVISNSNYTKIKAKKTYGRDSHVIYLGVDDKKFYPIDGKKEFDLLFVGSTSALDGFDTFLEISNHLPKDTKTKSLLSELEWVTDMNKLNRIYNKSRLMIALAVREPLGLVPLEAMSAGIPVLAVNDGGYKETIIDGMNGFLIPRDAKLFAKKIRILLSKKTLLNELSINARASVLEKWTWENSVNEFYKLFESESNIQ